MKRVKPALAYAHRRADSLTRRKLGRPSSTPATISSAPTSCSDAEPERSGAAAASAARTRATVPRPNRSRVTAREDGSAIAVLRGARGHAAAQRLDLLGEGFAAAADRHRRLLG